MTLLDQLLPRFDFSERHRRDVAAPPDRVWAAIEAVSLREMPLTYGLMAIRSVPERLRGRPGLPSELDRAVLGQMIEFGFARMASEAPRELVTTVVAGVAVGPGDLVDVSDADEFVAFETPGYIKAAMNFHLRELGDGRTRLETETRVEPTDERSRRRFRLYWLAIRAGSGAIRRDWLRAIARRAERERA